MPNRRIQCDAIERFRHQGELKRPVEHSGTNPDRAVQTKQIPKNYALEVISFTIVDRPVSVVQDLGYALYLRFRFKIKYVEND